MGEVRNYHKFGVTSYGANGSNSPQLLYYTDPEMSPIPDRLEIIDFAGDTIGQPATQLEPFWSDLLVKNWLVTAAGLAHGAGTSGEAWLSYNRLKNISDLEVKMQFTRTVNNADPASFATRILLRSWGTETNPDGFVVAISGDGTTLRMQRLFGNGAVHDFATITLPTPVVPAGLHNIKAQMNGRKIRVKVWPEIDAEPDWLFEDTGPRGVIPDRGGRVGFGAEDGTLGDVVSEFQIALNGEATT